VAAQVEFLGTIVFERGSIFKVRARMPTFSTQTALSRFGLDLDYKKYGIHIRGVEAEELKELRSISVALHDYIRQMGVPSPVDEQATWVPHENREKVMNEIEKFQQKFEAVRNRFIQKYPEIREKAKAGWQEDAQKIYRQLNLAEPEDSFITRFISFMHKIFPPDNELISKMRIDVYEYKLQPSPQLEQRIYEFIASIEQEICQRLIEELNKMRSHLTGTGRITDAGYENFSQLLENFRELFDVSGNYDMMRRLEEFEKEFLSRQPWQYKRGMPARDELLNEVEKLVQEAEKESEKTDEERVQRFIRGSRKIQL